MSPSHVLTLNSGSSSLKLSLFELQPGASEPKRLLEASAENIAQDSMVKVQGQGVQSNQKVALKDAGEALDALLKKVQLPEEIQVGHRLVHGGPRHLMPERVTPSLLRSLRDSIPFAPLHLPSELKVIDAVAERLPRATQYVCFDTTFHRDLPERAKRLPLPRALRDDGVHRYGFHGLSCESIVQQLGPGRPGRVVIAHLGSGSSLTAVRDGRSQDTTMGMTPTGGVMMGSRTGDLDPGVIVYLMRRGWDADTVERCLNRDSGLRGVSGSTSDMKALLAKRDQDPEAALAVELFCYQVRKAIASLAAALEGLDTLVFTGGIGERSVEIRQEVCRGLGILGITLDGAANSRSAEVISSPGARPLVRVMATDEAMSIARAGAALFQG